MFFEEKNILLLTVTNFLGIPPIYYKKGECALIGKKWKQITPIYIYIYLFLVTLSNNIYIKCLKRCNINTFSVLLTFLIFSNNLVTLSNIFSNNLVTDIVYMKKSPTLGAICMLIKLFCWFNVYLVR